jgi:hypothetical protein
MQFLTAAGAAAGTDCMHSAMSLKTRSHAQIMKQLNQSFNAESSRQSSLEGFRCPRTLPSFFAILERPSLTSRMSTRLGAVALRQCLSCQQLGTSPLVTEGRRRCGSVAMAQQRRPREISERPVECWILGDRDCLEDGERCSCSVTVGIRKKR